jgi:2,3,4,5-tetrahydropyridine-2,6-dicarboxylate N-succinyltransferase
MNPTTLEPLIEHYFAQGAAAIGNPEALAAFHQLRDALEAGTLRAAEPDPTAPPLFGGQTYRVNAWVKRGILLGFRIGVLTQMGAQTGQLSPSAQDLSFVDKDTYPIRRFTAEQGIRIVPGGSSVRAGAHLAPGVVIMPPAYVNVGAYIGEHTMIDSHALVGSCAQIGKRVHLSAAAQIGGVLEPVNASPVIIEDDVLIGGNTGVYEGTIVRARAVLAAGVILTRGTPVYDLPNNTLLKSTPEGPNGEPATPLIIPAGAVVVAGTRPIQQGPGKALGLSIYTPIIIKYRDEKTDLSTTLEDLLR